MYVAGRNKEHAAHCEAFMDRFDAINYAQDNTDGEQWKVYEVYLEYRLSDMTEIVV